MSTESVEDTNKRLMDWKVAILSTSRDLVGVVDFACTDRNVVIRMLDLDMDWVNAPFMDLNLFEVQVMDIESQRKYISSLLETPASLATFLEYRDLVLTKIQELMLLRPELLHALCIVVEKKAAEYLADAGPGKLVTVAARCRGVLEMMYPYLARPESKWDEYLEKVFGNPEATERLRR